MLVLVLVSLYVLEDDQPPVLHAARIKVRHSEHVHLGERVVHPGVLSQLLQGLGAHLARENNSGCSVHEIKKTTRNWPKGARNCVKFGGAQGDEGRSPNLCQLVLVYQNRISSSVFNKNRNAGQGLAYSPRTS